MNVILFVTTLIMALAMLTYAKLDLFRSLQVVKVQFENYMEKTERSAINQTAQEWYNKVKAETKQGSANAVTNASARLSLKPFVDSEAQTQMAKEFPQLQILAQKLIRVLYSNTPFYQTLIQQRPDFVNALLSQLSVANNFPKEKKLKNARDLNTLHLPDPQLDEVLYKMLKGMPYPEKPAIIAGETNDDAAPDANLKEEYKSPVGYTSLLDYVTLKPTAKIRVFLAPRALLQAIFDDPATVDEIISTRYQLYRDLSNDKAAVQATSQLFKQQFLGRSDPNFNETILDFTVSKTNPRNYE